MSIISIIYISFSETFFLLIDVTLRFTDTPGQSELGSNTTEGKIPLSPELMNGSLTTGCSFLQSQGHHF